MNITKQEIKNWLDEKRFPIKTESLANLITQCFNELSPKIKAEAVSDAINECRYNGADGQGWENDLEQYVIKLEGGE